MIRARNNTRIEVRKMLAEYLVEEEVRREESRSCESRSDKALINKHYGVKELKSNDQAVEDVMLLA